MGSLTGQKFLIIIFVGVRAVGQRSRYDGVLVKVSY